MKKLNLLVDIAEVRAGDTNTLEFGSATAIQAMPSAHGTKFTFYLHLGGTVATISLEIQVSVDATNWIAIKTVTATTADQCINDVAEIKAPHMRAEIKVLTGSNMLVSLWGIYD